MDAIIDIEALSKMTITEEFAKLLFGDNFDMQNININSELRFAFNDKCVSITHEYEAYYFAENGEIDYQLTSQTEPLKNAFQIVRYIDNYLNKIKNV